MVETNTLPANVLATFDLDGIGTPSAVTALVLPAGTTYPAVNFGYHLVSPIMAALNGSTFVKITTINYGWQEISATNVAALLGLPVATITNAIGQGQLQLANLGQPVTWFASPGGANLLFYAECHRDNYSTNNFYFLTAQTNGLPGVENGQGPSPSSAALWYPASVNYKVNAYYESSLPLGAEDDPWMWQVLNSASHLGSAVNDFMVLDHLTQGADRAAQLSLQLWGAAANTNQIMITVNTNYVLGTWSWYGVTPTNLLVTIPSAYLVNGSNKLTIQAINNGLSPASQSYLNNFTLSYPRAYTATNGLIDFTANSNSVISVDGFSSNIICLIDVSNPKQPLLVTNVTLDKPSTTWRISFVPACPTAHYVAAQSGVAAPVYSVALGQISGFAASGNAADYIIVAPPSLLTSATNLANYRQQTGLKTLIAPLDQVYNEFGHGFPTPHAVQALVAAGWTNWINPPRYLVLLGKGTYDFLNVNNFSNNLTPPLMVSTPYGVYATDSLMGDVYGNGLPKVAVGRLPGLTTNDINALIAKIEAYENSPLPANPQALLIADATSSSGNFSADLQRINAVLTNKFNDTLLFSLNAGNAEPVHSQITNHWKAGVDLVTYAGEGSIVGFGSAGYLTSTDVTNLLGTCPRLPVVTAFACNSGQYSQPSGNCLGESILKPVNGGGIAYFGATGLSLSGEADQLNLRLSTLLGTNTQLCLGDMIVQSVAAHVTLDLPSVPVWIYNLLGDPALHYHVALRTVAGGIWNDGNGNGLWDAGEAGIGGVTVFVDLNHSGSYKIGDPMAVTDTNGNYVITNLLAGTYTVVVGTNTLPTGAVPTFDLDGTATPNAVLALSVPVSTNDSNVNFGYQFVSIPQANFQAGSFQSMSGNLALESSVSSPITLSINQEAGGIRVTWSGGMPPYHLEEAIMIGNPAMANSKVNPVTTWVEVPLTDRASTTVLLPLEPASAFFRVYHAQPVVNTGPRAAQNTTASISSKE